MSAGRPRIEHRAFDELTPRELHDVLKLRSDIFIVEQRITDEPDLDGLDPTAVHVFARDAHATIVGAARVRYDGEEAKVERVVVREDLRGSGLGVAIMEYVHDLLASRMASLSAQLSAVPFYERLGWHTEGNPYDEAGIPHQRMTRTP